MSRGEGSKLGACKSGSSLRREWRSTNTIPPPPGTGGWPREAGHYATILYSVANELAS